MQGTFVAPGVSIDYTPGGSVGAGAVVVQGSMAGIAKRDIAASALGSLFVSGIFDIVKAAEAFASVGAKVYWDATGNPYGGVVGSGAATATASGNTMLGFVAEANAVVNSGLIRVILIPAAAAAEAIALADLSDMGATAYTAGKLMVASGTAYAEVALSGPFNLSAAGLLSMDAAAVVAAGSVQGDAGAMADGLSLVSAADATKGAVLPAAAAGGLVVVKNNANAVLKLWPASGDAIDALGADNAMSIPAYATRILVAYDATTWYSTDIQDAELAIAKLASWKEGNVAVAADALAIPVTHRHVSKTTGADAEALTLADGVAGQLLTIDLVVDGNGAGTLTPTTMTGFATIVLDDAGDQVTLQYIDDSVGWVIVGAAGVAAPPVITI